VRSGARSRGHAPFEIGNVDILGVARDVDEIAQIHPYRLRKAR
jgi:hypothetical protein